MAPESILRKQGSTISDDSKTTKSSISLSLLPHPVFSSSPVGSETASGGSYFDTTTTRTRHTPAKKSHVLFQDQMDRSNTGLAHKGKILRRKLSQLRGNKMANAVSEPASVKYSDVKPTDRHSQSTCNIGNLIPRHGNFSSSPDMPMSQSYKTSSNPSVESISASLLDTSHSCAQTPSLTLNSASERIDQVSDQQANTSTRKPNGHHKRLSRSLSKIFPTQPGPDFTMSESVQTPTKKGFSKLFSLKKLKKEKQDSPTSQYNASVETTPESTHTRPSPHRKPVVPFPQLHLSATETSAEWKSPLLEFFPEEKDAQGTLSDTDGHSGTSSIMSNDSPKTPPYSAHKHVRLPSNVNTSIATGKSFNLETDSALQKIESMQKTYNSYSNQMKELQHELDQSRESRKKAGKSDKAQLHVETEIEEALGQVEKARHEAGLLLSRLYKKRRESMGASDYWVRSVGIA